MTRQRGSTPLVFLALAQVLLFAYYLHETMIRQPYWDMYSYIVRYLQFRRDGGWWAYLWEPHVQHRQPWMRLLTALDAEVYSGVSYPFIAFATACQFVTAWLVWRQVRAARPGAAGVTLACLSVMLTLTVFAAVDCAIPMNGIYPQALAFTVGALVLFDSGGSTAGIHWRRVAAMASAMAGAFANAAALIAWPILLWLAWRTGAGRLWIIVVAATGVLFGAAYVDGLPIAAEAHIGLAGGAAGAELWRAATYLFTYLGLPWTRVASLEAVGRVAGACLFVTSVAAVVRYGFQRPADRVERLAVGLIAFSLATALLAAAGRTGVETGVLVPVRYTVFVAPMHVGLLLLAWPVLFPGGGAVRRLRVERAAAVALGLVLLAQQVASGETAAATTRAMRDTLARFAAGEESDDMKTVVFVDLPQARRDLNAIHGAGLYLRVE